MALPKEIQSLQGVDFNIAEIKKYSIVQGAVKNLDNISCPKDTAYHESVHAVTAVSNGTSVDSVTIVPGVGFLGLTRLSKPDAIAAIAPHADGCSGTSHDLHIAESLGHNPSSLAGIARGIISQNRAEILEVRRKLHEKGTLTGGEVNDAINEAREKKNNNARSIKEITLFVSKEGGNLEKIVYTREGKKFRPKAWTQINT